MKIIPGMTRIRFIADFIAGFVVGFVVGFVGVFTV